MCQHVPEIEHIVQQEKRSDRFYSLGQPYCRQHAPPSSLHQRPKPLRNGSLRHMKRSSGQCRHGEVSLRPIKPRFNSTAERAPPFKMEQKRECAENHKRSHCPPLMRHLVF